MAQVRRVLITESVNEDGKSSISVGPVVHDMRFIDVFSIVLTALFAISRDYAEKNKSEMKKAKTEFFHVLNTILYLDDHLLKTKGLHNAVCKAFKELKK